MYKENSAHLSAHDVAAELRRQLPKAGTLKIHKLLYYVQGWHLVWAGKPAFKEPIQAWAKVLSLVRCGLMRHTPGDAPSPSSSTQR